MTRAGRLSNQALLAIAAALAVLGTGLRPTDHVHLDAEHAVHHAHAALTPHQHGAAPPAPLHAHAGGHSGHDDLQHLILEQTGHHGGAAADHHRDADLHGGPVDDRDRDHHGDDPSPAPTAPQMVWTAMALAMAPLLSAPAAPSAIGRAPPIARLDAPLDVSRPLPLPRGPPA